MSDMNRRSVNKRYIVKGLRVIDWERGKAERYASQNIAEAQSFSADIRHNEHIIATFENPGSFAQRILVAQLEEEQDE